MENLKNLIENKLACIDIETKYAKKHQACLLHHELHGIKQALYFMGIVLEYSINPYFHENGEPSRISKFELV